MREQSDIKTIVVAVQGTTTIDLERVEEDPQWDVVSREFDLRDPAQFKQALEHYVSRYLGLEVLLGNAPFTNGPADVISTSCEVK